MMVKEKLIAHFRSGEKVHEQFSIKAEFAHLIVQKGDLKAVSFSGPTGVEQLLVELTKKGWTGIKEEQKIVGLEKEGTSITLGAGCQLKIAIKNTTNIKEMDDIYLDFLKDIFPLLEEKNQIMLAIGYQPASKINEVESGPQKSHQFLNQFFEDQGKYGLHMIKGMATTVLTIDYAHQDDFRKKLKVIYAIAPIISALFDNSPIFEGEAYKENCLHRLISTNSGAKNPDCLNMMDENFSYSKYATFLTKAPSIWRQAGTEVIYTGEKTLAELDQEQPLNDVELEQQIETMTFGDIGLNKAIEIRMGDALPYPLNMTYITLWKTLLYSPENLNSLYEFAMTITAKDILTAKENMITQGLDTILGKGTLRDIAKDLFFMAGNYSLPDEARYLEPLEAIIFKEIIPKDVTAKHLLAIK